MIFILGLFHKMVTWIYVTPKNKSDAFPEKEVLIYLVSICCPGKFTGACHTRTGSSAVSEGSRRPTSPIQASDYESSQELSADTDVNVKIFIKDHSICAFCVKYELHMHWLWFSRGE